MNYLAHAVRFLDRPEFAVGTGIPDWLTVLGRPMRLRSRDLHPYFEDSSRAVRELAAGIDQHFIDDDWFHTTRAFVEVTAELTLLFRERCGTDDNFRAGLLGHIGCELLLDACLIESSPNRLQQYYHAIMQVDPAWLGETLATIRRALPPQRAGQSWTLPFWLKAQPAAIPGVGVPGSAVRNARPDGLLAAATVAADDVSAEFRADSSSDLLVESIVGLHRRFCDERFLADYQSDSGLARRLNHIWRRIKLSPLPDSLVDALAEARRIVYRRRTELLPSPRYDWS